MRTTELWTPANVAVRAMQFDKPGQVVPGHAHNFPHLTLASHGALKFNFDGNAAPVIKRAGEWHNSIDIPAGREHTITSLAPDESFKAGKIADELLAREALPPRAELIALVRAHLEADQRSLGLCIYAHRIPQALVERAGRNAEYDALLGKTIAMANEVFGDIVQDYDGWRPAYE